MTSRIKNFSVLVLILSFLALSGCAATGVTGGDAAVLGDLNTERSIIRAIRNEPSLSNSNIQVGCVDGIVTLSGNVESNVERQLAERITKGIDGVVSVSNNLQTDS